MNEEVEDGWTKKEKDLVINTINGLEDILNNFPNGGKLIIHKDGSYTLVDSNGVKINNINKKYDKERNH